MEKQRVPPGIRWAEGGWRIPPLEPQSCIPPPSPPLHAPGLPEAAVVTLHPGPAHSLLRHPAHCAPGCLQGPAGPVRPQRPAQRSAEPAGEPEGPTTSSALWGQTGTTAIPYLPRLPHLPGTILNTLYLQGSGTPHSCPRV